MDLCFALSDNDQNKCMLSNSVKSGCLGCRENHHFQNAGRGFRQKDICY